MIIAIDGNEANIKKRVGSNEYAYQILSNIWKIYNSELSLPAAKTGIKNENLEFRIFLKDKPLSDLPKPTRWWQYQVLTPRVLWTQWRLPLELILKRKKIDLFFSPGHYAPRFCPQPLVISIMDLAFLRFADQFKPKDLYTLINWTQRSVRQADHILTISEFSKREIEHFYKVPAKKITVTYPGIKKLKIKSEKLKTEIKNLKRKYQVDGNYFLYIGTLQPRKNLIRLIKAYAQLTSEHSKFKLVIVGKKGWLYRDIFQLVEKLRLGERVIFTGYIREKTKTALLKNALALILPSLYEGFGIPVLEAMQLGCPVIVSKDSSLPEVAGKAGIYIDNPLSVESIQKAMLKMVKLDKNQRQKLAELEQAQIEKFSWSQAAKKTLMVLKEVAHVCY